VSSAAAGKTRSSGEGFTEVYEDPVEVKATAEDRTRVKKVVSREEEALKVHSYSQLIRFGVV
jgi:hypothetical protein